MNDYSLAVGIRERSAISAERDPQVLVTDTGIGERSERSAESEAHPLPRRDRAMFHGLLGELVEAIDPHTEASGEGILVSLLAVTAFATWLIIHNRLWQRSNTQETRWRERIDNLATVGTIGMTAILIYLLAFAVMLMAATVVIPVAYLESELERDVGYLTYISIAWLSASLGTMAGALGSNFDRDVEIRSATYNLREYQRRTQQGNYVELDEL